MYTSIYLLFHLYLTSLMQHLFRENKIELAPLSDCNQSKSLLLKTNTSDTKGTFDSSKEYSTSRFEQLIPKNFMRKMNLEINNCLVIFTKLY